MIRFRDVAIVPTNDPARCVMRRSLLPLIILCSVAWPVAASAQTTNPLANCKTSLAESESFEYPLAQGSTTAHEGFLRGKVRVICDEMTLQAQEIRWREDSPMVYATGDVVFLEKGTQIQGQRAEMNRQTKLGKFFDAHGWMEIENQKPDRSLFGTQEPSITFWADEIEKTNDHTYVLKHGGFTSCRQPTPRWDMVATKLTLIPGEHAILRNMVLRVKDVPLFYLPALYYPIAHENRATGFLIPTYGNSTIRGLMLSNAFFWAISRSQDATIYHDYYSKTGQGYAGEYRYVGDAGSSGNVRVRLENEKAQYADEEKTIVSVLPQRSFTIDGNLSQGLAHGIRVTGHANYFSSIRTQQLYQQNLYDSTQRTRAFGGSVTGGVGRYRFAGQVEQTDVFTNTQAGQAAARYGGRPLGTFTISEKPIGRSPVYFGANFSGGNLLRQDNIDDPLTNRSLWRFDGGPTVTVPVSNLPALTVTTSAALRYTYWTQSVDSSLGQVATPISRRVMSLQARVVGPVVSRVWRTPQNRYAEGFKHLIEPNITIGWLSTYKDSSKIVVLDGTDLLTTGTTSVNYGLTSRLLAKRPTGAAPPAATGIVREILTASVGQTYYSDALAAKYDPQYQSSFTGVDSSYKPPSPFSPIQFSVIGRPSDTTSGQFRLEYDHLYGAVRQFSASGSVDEPAAEVVVGWSKQQIIPGLPGFSAPSNFMNVSTTIRDPGNSVGGTFVFNRDMVNKYFLSRRFRIYYNSQCCGMAFDLQTVDLSHTSGLGFNGSDRRMAILFTLAGIGTFSNPLGAFGGNTGTR